MHCHERNTFVLFSLTLQKQHCYPPCKNSAHGLHVVTVRAPALLQQGQNHIQSPSHSVTSKDPGSERTIRSMHTGPQLQARAYPEQQATHDAVDEARPKCSLSHSALRKVPKSSSPVRQHSLDVIPGVFETGTDTVTAVNLLPALSHSARDRE